MTRTSRTARPGTSRRVMIRLRRTGEAGAPGPGRYRKGRSVRLVSLLTGCVNPDPGGPAPP
ncbi:hypothetical protein DIJ69_05435 [Streptomyces globisporus]|nr:hypothetical protein DIJ69_05435 [Streptomyces globisporus]